VIFVIGNHRLTICLAPPQVEEFSTSMGYLLSSYLLHKVRGRLADSLT
jgi:hypothetical protein